MKNGGKNKSVAFIILVSVYIHKHTSNKKKIQDIIVLLFRMFICIYFVLHTVGLLL